MKILIYLGHPAQFYFYKKTVQRLILNGNKVLVLLKTKDILQDLVGNSSFEYINIQKKLRKNNKLAMFFASILRTYHVYRIAYKFDADILLGTDASIAQAGFLLGHPAITTLEDDYDVIEKLARITFPFTTHILTPTPCNVGEWEKKKISYQGYMKLAYLHPNQFLPDINVLHQYIQTDKFCIVRISQLAAHHDVGIKGLNVVLVKNVVDRMELAGYKVFISSESVVDECLLPYALKINPIDIHHVLAFASLLISDSQSMSVEAAMLGVPSIRFSDFAGRISVLEELEHTYHLTFGVKANHQAKLFGILDELLKKQNLNSVFQERRQKMLDDKIDVTAFMVWFIENYPSSAVKMKEDPNFQNRFKVGSICSESSPLNVSKISTSNIDFTTSTYRQLLLALKSAGYASYTFEDWCEGRAKGRYVILRHDVDLKASHSLRTAKIEAALGMRASYYFRYIPESNQPEVIKAIAALGHEIGYHYEELSIFNGNPDNSIDHFQKQLAHFRKFYPVKTISMHGSPSSNYDNREIWKHYNYRDFGIIGEPYFDFLSSNKLNEEHLYFTDTARMWDGDRFNVRDKSDVSKLSTVNRPQIHSTFDFIDWLKTNPSQEVMMITTHPQRWTDDRVEWWMEFLMQGVKNVVKRLLYVNS